MGLVCAFLCGLLYGWLGGLARQKWLEQRTRACILSALESCECAPFAWQVREPCCTDNIEVAHDSTCGFAFTGTLDG